MKAPMPLPEAVADEPPTGAKRLAVTRATTHRGILDAMPERVDIHLPKQSTHGNGVPGGTTDLTDAVANRILSAIRSTGCSLGTAARFAGKHPDTVRLWTRKQGEPYETFALEVLKSRSHWEIRLALAVVHAATRDDARQRPELALQLLERRLPKTYGRALATAAASATVNLTQIIRKISAAPVVDPRDLPETDDDDEAADEKTPASSERPMLAEFTDPRDAAEAEELD